MTLTKCPTFDERRKLLPHDQWTPAPGANYLVYDDSRDAPVGFAIRVGKKASTFLVEKMVAGRKMKIHVGLARGRKGAEKWS